MSSRVSRILFGPLSASAVEAVEVVNIPVARSASETNFLGQLRQKFRSDEEIVEQLQSGDADALTILFSRHSPLLFGIARRILRNDADAEDAVQQIFLDVFRSIQQFDPEKENFRAWLLMFAYHRRFNFRRSLAANRFFDTDPLEDILPELVRGAEPTLGYSPAETSILIEQILKSLQPRQRRTIELVYYEGLTAEEVSTRTGETVRVVRHNLYRGLEKLRKALCEHRPLTERGAGKGVR